MSKTTFAESAKMSCLTDNYAVSCYIYIGFQMWNIIIIILFKF